MKSILAAFGAVMVFTASTAMAIPITGSINFGGRVQYTQDPGLTPSNLASATGLKFVYGTPHTEGGTDAYASIEDGTAVTFTDFKFSPFSPAPIELWTLNSGGLIYDFMLQSITDVKVYTPVQALILGGTGTLRIINASTHQNVYDPTDALFELSFPWGGTGKYSFAANNVVPEPGTMVLLGAGFLVLAIYVKRRKNT